MFSWCINVWDHYAANSICFPMVCKLQLTKSMQSALNARNDITFLWYMQYWGITNQMCPAMPLLHVTIIACCHYNKYKMPKNKNVWNTHKIHSLGIKTKYDELLHGEAFYNLIVSAVCKMLSNTPFLTTKWQKIKNKYRS